MLTPVRTARGAVSAERAAPRDMVDGARGLLIGKANGRKLAASDTYSANAMQRMANKSKTLVAGSTWPYN